MSIIQLKKDLRQYATKERKKTNEWFFKTGKGEYGEHDQFLGISNPDVRRVAKKYRDEDIAQLQQLIESEYNEDRLCSLIILVERFRRNKKSEQERKEIYDFYVKNLNHINNWNLVDLSAPHILGEYVVAHKSQKKVLNTLAGSDSQWNRRVCILATWAFTKRDDFIYTLKYAKQFLSDEEDLMHKAVGWMLREVWKRDSNVCEKFLKENYDQLPRTTLRYAIERMKEQERQRLLKKDF